MKYKLSDLVDVDRLQTLMDDFYQVTEAPTAILEADGTVLTATGWQPVCTKFHRVCPELAARCTKSDVYIAEHLDEGEPYVVYECANGLVDVAAPIIVEGEHIGTVFTGQFLFEAPDVERFRKQAREFGLDEEAYLAALAQVPIVSRERLDPLLTYLSNFAVMLADVGLEQLKSERLEKEMGESETKLRAIFSAMPDIVMVLDREGRYVEIAPTNPDLLYKPPNDLAGQLMHDVLPPAAADAYLEQIYRVLDSGSPENFEYTLPVQSGEVTFFATITPLTEDRVVWVARDITERKQAEAERERFTRRLSTAADIATQVNTILDPDELLKTVIPLIKERFGLYYVHVYTLDEERGALNLRAGYGEAGEKMLAEGHSIPLDREASLVATAARTQEPVLVNDVTANPNFMPNPLLPDTKAEVAVPAIAGDEVLGVFDVQHDEKNYFTAADLDAFRTLAGQIATAFRNARIFEAQAEAEAEARRNAAQRAALLNAIPDLMFRFDSDGTFLDYKAEAGAKLLAPPEVFLGHHVSEVLPPFLAEMTLEHLDKALQTGEQVIYEYQAPVDDAMHHYEARMVPSGDGQVLALIRDITDIREAREAQARFAAQLGTAAEIAARVNAVLDPDELFNMVIPLTKERFDLYHVHFYAFDPESETLNLRAGYGRAGELMLRQGHKIPLDRERSIVARAARDRELIVINDVTAAPDHLPNMLLPDTKSEVAVPAIVGDQLLGVLDVQADEADFFSESDLDVYRTLVGQIATAYQNARYFERQRESEAALRESAEKIRAIFNAITDGISVTNMTGEITDLNAALLDLHGYQQRDELLGRNTMELIAREDWPTATQNINHTLDEGSSRNQEMLLVRKGGGLFDGELSTALLQDEEGNPTGIISVVRDISERKRREAALRLTRASVDNAEDEIFWFDTEGNFFDVNRAACEILGYTREELLEMRVFDIDPDFPEEAWPGLLAQIREEGAVTLTSQHMTKSGEIFPVEVTVNYLKFGDHEYIFSFAHDITERQRVEEERRRFTTQLRTAAEVAGQINAILDPQELLAEVVPMVQERFSLYHVHVYILDEETGNLEMRVGTGEAGRVMLEEGHKIPLDRAKSLVARAARSKQPVLVNDVTQDPDFMPNPLLPDTKSEVAVPAIAGDRVLGVFDVQDDERNRFTESDLDVSATLASQIAIAFQNAQYFEEVQRTAERLREVDRLKGEFLANMSHELRTPLNSILGYTEVILMGIDGPLNDEMKEDIDAIHKNGKHLLRLINDILDLTKIEAGRLKLEQEEVYLSPLFDDVRTNNIGYFHKQKTDIDFRVQVLDEDMRVYADRVRLTQILNNLVSNAAKFTDEGFVEMRAYRDGDWACMEVEDTGIGIAEEDLGTVFERFRQVDGSNARRAEGTGLGLAITKHLVEMHGGHLEIHSEPGKGSIFTAYVPIYDPDAEANEENSSE